MRSLAHWIERHAAFTPDIITVDELTLSANAPVKVVFDTAGADGNVHIDAVRLLKVN